MQMAVFYLLLKIKMYEWCFKQYADYILNANQILCSSENTANFMKIFSIIVWLILASIQFRTSLYIE